MHHLSQQIFRNITTCGSEPKMAQEREHSM